MSKKSNTPEDHLIQAHGEWKVWRLNDQYVLKDRDGNTIHSEMKLEEEFVQALAFTLRFWGIRQEQLNALPAPRDTMDRMIRQVLADNEAEVGEDTYAETVSDLFGFEFRTTWPEVNFEGLGADRRDTTPNPEVPLRDRFTKESVKWLKGRKIKLVRYLSDEETENFGWFHRPLLIQLDDGTMIFPSSDTEGNDSGSWLGQGPEPEHKHFTIPVLRG